MKYIKKILIYSILSSCFIASSTSALTTDQQGAISTNCDTIKQTLTQLAKYDSRTRVYLGTAYENILTRFMTPLNLRLTKNNQPNTDLTSVQSNFIAKRNVFNNNFTDYMKKLEELTAIDCKNHPEDFYAKLQETRSARAILQTNTLELNSLVHDHVETVTSLKENL